MRDKLNNPDIFKTEEQVELELIQLSSMKSDLENKQTILQKLENKINNSTHEIFFKRDSILMSTEGKFMQSPTLVFNYVTFELKLQSELNFKHRLMKISFPGHV